MNRNYTIKTIAIPLRDENGEKTGEYITLEVVSLERLKTSIQQFEGGVIHEEKLYFLCFEKAVGKPRKLYVISAETDGEIEILKYERYGKNNEFRGGYNPRKRKNSEDRIDTGPGINKSKK